MDAEHDDISAALSNTICRDGQSTTTARVPFASGVSAAAGTTASVAYAQTNDPNTGLYFPATDQWGLVAGGTASLTSTAAKLTATVAVDFTGAAAPASDGGAALGSPSQKWSDLFLAPGGIINFNSGDVTVTHSSNALAVAGGAVSFDSQLTISSGGIIVSAGGASITGNSSITGTFSVSQAATFSSSIQAASATFSGNMTSSGAVSGATATGSMVATQSEQETGSATDKLVTSGRQHFHPSAAKAWGQITYSGGTPSLVASYNIASIVDSGTGLVSITFANAMSSNNYVVMGTLTGVLGTLIKSLHVISKSTGSMNIQTYGASASNNVIMAQEDVPFDFAVFGDQ